MPYVITLLADTRNLTLSDEFITDVTLLLSLRDIHVSRRQWLAPLAACELYADGRPEAMEDAMRESLRSHPIDFLIQPDPKPRYKLLISDMDSTMITVECIDELADFVGKKAHVAAITERAMNGELQFEEALSERVALLAGLSEATLQECYDARVAMMPGAHELLAAHKARGGYSVLVSGGFTFFTSRVAKALGFDEDHSNRLEIEGGKLTGRVIAPILGKEAKLATLHATCMKLGITPEETLAIGDGANDLPMLLAAGMGVAYHAKPVVRAQAKAQLNYSDLAALRWL